MPSLRGNILCTLSLFKARITLVCLCLFLFTEKETEAENENIMINLVAVWAGMWNWTFPYNFYVTAGMNPFCLCMLGRSQIKFQKQPLKECLFSLRTLKFLSDIQANCAPYFVIQSNAEAVLYFFFWNSDPRNLQQHEFLSVKEL